MLVAEAVNTDTRVLRSNDTIEIAIQQLDAQHTNTLPVVESITQQLMGMLKRHHLKGITDDKKHTSIIGDFALDEPIFIYNNQHLFHAVRLMLQHELRLLPVVDNNMIFRGVIEKNQVLASLGKMLNLNSYGSVITIRLNKNDFTLSEITQLIETEGGKILGITVEAPDSQSHFYEVSIKLNLHDVSRVAASLRRFGYTVLTEERSESNNIDLETRADEFLKYLDI